VVSFDFRTDEICLVGDFAKLVLRKLLEGLEDHSVELWTSPSLSVSSYDQESTKSMIVELLSSFRTVFVLDHLHLTHSAWIVSNYVPGSLGEAIKSDIAEFLKLITDFAVPQSLWCDSFLVCIGRHSKCSKFESQLGVQLKDCGIELYGLGLSDSMEMSYSIL
jgi:hypothetical protein